MSNLTRLEQKVRLAVPGANPQVINSPDLWLFINDGAKDVNQRMKVRRVNTTFTDPAFGGGTPLAKFAISQFITDFVCFDDSGLYYQNGSLWQQLLPKDRKWMDENVYSWRNFQNGAPLYYIQEPDSLEILPPPAVVYNPSYWIYYIQQVVYMTNGDQFPFVGTNVEVPAYSCLDDAIIGYCQWKLQALLGNKAQGVMDENDYLNLCMTVQSIFTRRPDLNMSRYFKMQGPVCHAGGR